MHFLYGAPVVFLATLIGIVLGSLLAPQPSAAARLRQSPAGLARGHAQACSRPWFENYRYLSALLLSLTAAIIWCFR